MKRRLLITLLGFGTIFGFSTGIASMSHGWHHRAERRQANFEAHIADVCVGAAERSRRADEAWDRPPPDHWQNHTAHDRRGPPQGHR